MCTNTIVTPDFSISLRFFATSERASRQNGQPECRKKTTKTGERCDNSANPMPVFVTAFSGTEVADAFGWDVIDI